ncbi:hypothetical protein Hanom_Chr10g00885071 [Helianthus anomalus]
MYQRKHTSIRFSKHTKLKKTLSRGIVDLYETSLTKKHPSSTDSPTFSQPINTFETRNSLHRLASRIANYAHPNTLQPVIHQPKSYNSP